MSARPAAFLALIAAYSLKGTTGQDGAELAATTLHSRLAKYDRNFRPGYGGPPVQVGVRVRQLAIEGGEVRIQLGVTWQDLRLAHEVDGVKEIRFAMNLSVPDKKLFTGWLLNGHQKFGNLKY